MSDGGIFRPDLLAGRVALVTGGGTGIGFGIASCLAAAGASVALASRKPEHLESAAERLRAAGARVATVETNVREPEAAARMVERVVGELGRLDILVNNAAGNFYAPSASLSPNAWRAVVELRHFQDMSYDEIAIALKLPVSDVKSHLFRARTKLKELFEQSE